MRGMVNIIQGASGIRHPACGGVRHQENGIRRRASGVRCPSSCFGRRIPQAANLLPDAGCQTPDAARPFSHSNILNLRFHRFPIVKKVRISINWLR